MKRKSLSCLDFITQYTSNFQIIIVKTKTKSYLKSPLFLTPTYYIVVTSKHTKTFSSVHQAHQGNTQQRKMNLVYPLGSATFYWITGFHRIGFQQILSLAIRPVKHRVFAIGELNHWLESDIISCDYFERNILLG